MDSLAWTAEDARLLGDRIREHRRRQQLTQEQVAFAAGLTRAHYALLEAGQSSSRRPGTYAAPKITTIAAIAAVLDVPMTELFPFDEPPHEEAARTARAILGRRDPGGPTAARG